MDKFYRVEAIWNGDARTLMYVEFPIIKRTPSGTWIDVWGPGPKWVGDKWAKRYATPTKEEALESFRRRKARQVSILTRRLENAKLDAEAGEKGVFWPDCVGPIAVDFFDVVDKAV
jgi:hypothetical protein